MQNLGSLTRDQTQVSWISCMVRGSFTTGSPGKLGIMHFNLVLMLSFEDSKRVHWRRKMATHSSILAWKIPWTEEPGGLQSIGLRRVGHKWSNLACRLQHTRLPFPSLSPGVCSNLDPLSQWCHPANSSSVAPSPPALSLSQHQSFFFFPASVFSSESALHIRWPKCWSFSISPSSEYSWLISFRIDWFDFLAAQGTVKISSTTIRKHQFFST